VARIIAALTDDISRPDSLFGQFQEELEAETRITAALAAALATMSGRRPKPVQRARIAQGLVAVPSGQLQLLTVNKTSDVTDFLNANGFVLSGGEKVKRLYQYTGRRDGKARTEKVQWYKDIVLRDWATGEFFSGDAVRKILGLPLVSEQQDFEIKAGNLPTEFDVFIESTSFNRKLEVNSQILVDQTMPPSSKKNPCR
jgi:hypothetical protein